MSGPGDVVNGVRRVSGGTDSTSTTSSTSPMGEVIQPRIRSLGAEVATCRTITEADKKTWLDALTAEELAKLIRIRSERMKGWMPTMDDCDFMLEILAKLGV